MHITLLQKISRMVSRSPLVHKISVCAVGKPIRAFTPDAVKQLLLVTPGRHSWLAMESGDSSELEQLLSSRFLVHPMSHTGRLEGNRCSGAKGQLGKVPSEEGAFQEAQMDPWEVHQDKRPV